MDNFWGGVFHTFVHRFSTGLSTGYPQGGLLTGCYNFDNIKYMNNLYFFGLVFLVALFSLAPLAYAFWFLVIFAGLLLVLAEKVAEWALSKMNLWR